MITLQNERFVVRVNESLGGEITQIDVDGVELLAQWDSPVVLTQSSRYSKERHDWLSEYRGGWQLLVPNAGSECEADGVNHPFHGEWSRTQVSIVERSDTLLRMRAGTRLPIVVEREISLESNPLRLKLTTTVQNSSYEATSFVWGEHPAFKAQLGDRIDLPVASVMDGEGNNLGQWPLSGDTNPLNVVGAELPVESVHFITNVGKGWAALRRADIGVALAWDARDFPHIWLWRENGSKGFPFFGRASLIAIEPASSWPGTGLSEARKRGQAFTLSARESRSTVVSLVPFMATDFPVTDVSINGNIEFGS